MIEEQLAEISAKLSALMDLIAARFPAAQQPSAKTDEKLKVIPAADIAAITEDVPSEVSKEDVKKALQDAIAKIGSADKVFEIMVDKYGATNLSSVSTEQYQALIDDVQREVQKHEVLVQ